MVIMASRLHRWAVFCLLLSLLPLTSCTSRGTGAAKDVHLRFNWPVPSSVLVECEHEEGDGSESAWRYRIHATEGDVVGEIELRITDFEYLDVDDVTDDLDDPEFEAAMSLLLSAPGVRPTVVISKKGEFLRLDGWDRVADEYRELIRKSSSPPNEEKVERQVKKMTNSRAKLATEETLSEEWNLWVGYWRNQVFRGNEANPVSYSITAPLLGPAEVEALMSYRSKRKRGELRLRAVRDEAELRKSFLGLGLMMIPMNERTKEKVSRLKTQVGKCFVVDEVVLKTDPATLVPSSIIKTKTIHVEGWKSLWEDNEDMKVFWDNNNEVERTKFTWE